MTLGLVNRSDLGCLGLMTASMHLHIRHLHKIGTLQGYQRDSACYLLSSN